jgi:hypothetical protein
VSDLRPTSDADIIAWFNKVQRFDDASVSRQQASAHSKTPLPKVIDANNRHDVQTRMLSLLQGQPGVKTLDLPTPAAHDPRPFEVVGIPLSPGFHVVEIASQKLGSALLDERYGNQRTMYVRTSALVTNLGVHFKLGRENALAWVTTLDKGQPVANAQVRVSDCRGRELASATTNAQGLASLKGLAPEAPACQGDNRYRQAYFVSARATQAGVDDMAFTWSDWHRGIEPWRFNLPTSREIRPDERAHTIFDRTLLRAGETVSMKHLLRSETSRGLGLTTAQPDTLVVTHTGSGQRYTQALAWRTTATGVSQRREQLCHSPPPPNWASTRSSCAERPQLQQRPVPGGRVPPAGAAGPGRTRRQKGAGQGHQRAGGCAGQLRRWRGGRELAGARVGPGARQVPELQRLCRVQLHTAARPKRQRPGG